jgi:hypothetical protein
MPHVNVKLQWHKRKFAHSNPLLSSFFARLRRNKKVVGPTCFYSLFTISLLSKQEKCDTSLLFLSSLTLSSLILFYQTKCKRLFHLSLLVCDTHTCSCLNNLRLLHESKCFLHVGTMIISYAIGRVCPFSHFSK